MANMNRWMLHFENPPHLLNLGLLGIQALPPNIVHAASQHSLAHAHRLHKGRHDAHLAAARITQIFSKHMQMYQEPGDGQQHDGAACVQNCAIIHAQVLLACLPMPRHQPPPCMLLVEEKPTDLHFAMCRACLAVQISSYSQLKYFLGLHNPAVHLSRILPSASRRN